MVCLADNGYIFPMTREQVLDTLRAHEAELRRLGVLHAALFGSLARGDAGPRSDIDVMIDFDPASSISMWDYVGIVQSIQALLPGKVDVVGRRGMNRHIRPHAEREAVYAF